MDESGIDLCLLADVVTVGVEIYTSVTTRYVQL
jgi:hypothetical protein